MSFSILGLGTALPAHSITQQQAMALAMELCSEGEEQLRALRVLYRKSGVENRYTALPHSLAYEWKSDARTAARGPTTQARMQLYERHALGLAEQAARAAFRETHLEPAAITHLVTVSCTGFAAPGIDLQLIEALGLKPTTERLHIGFMGCHGAINGLRAAKALAAADPSARVLMCAVELSSVHYQFNGHCPVGRALFADGAAAVVGTQASDVASSRSQQPWRVAATGSCLVPNSADAMSWHIGDHGFEMSLSARVPDLVAQHLRPWVESWLAEHGTGVERIGSWAIHPGGPRVIGAVEECLNLERSRTAASREVLAECGNMSSPTVLFILDRLRRQNAPLPCVMLAFGPGLVIEAALVA